MKQDKISGFHKIRWRHTNSKYRQDRDETTGVERQNINQEVRRMCIVAQALIDQYEERFPEKFAKLKK
jgi:hypothetical protein